MAEGDCSDEGAGFWRFGLTLSDNWSSGAIEIIRKEVIATASTLKTLCGNTCSGMTSYQVFNEVYGDQTINLLKDGLGAGCMLLNCSEGTNAYLTGPNGPGLIIHELGHIFDSNINGTFGFGRTVLENSTIVDANRNYVEGTPIDAEGNPIAGGVWTRTDAGYRCNTYPCQQHPLNVDGGNTSGEDFADMFMNFVLGSTPVYESGGFNTNSAGTARYNWMYDNLIDWVPMSVSR